MTNFMYKLPAAAVCLEKEIPKLFPPQHVDEKVCCRVDARREVCEDDDNFNDGAADADHGAPTDLNLLAKKLVDVRNNFERLAADEKDADGNKGDGERDLVLLGDAVGNRGGGG